MTPSYPATGLVSGGLNNRSVPRERSAFRCQPYTDSGPPKILDFEGISCSSACDKNCSQCRRRNAKPAQQIMAELPPARMQLEFPPFSHVGADYFGLLLVRQRRSDIKCYSCLFTCMTRRAVCLELTVDLSTDALLNAIRRFISRYGETTHFYSDNGTNLVGAERVLREGIQAWNQSQIHNYFRKEIQWSFNPRVRVIWWNLGKDGTLRTSRPSITD